MPAAALPAVALAATLVFVLHAAVTGRSLATRAVRWWAPATRRQMLVASAVATFAVFGVTALAGLVLLGRWRAVATLPRELGPAARAIGFSGEADPAVLGELLPPLALGLGIGIALLWWRGRRGRRPIGLIYRSPVAARKADERGAAALIALAAGVGEELFFRVWLPLLVALVAGSAPVGFAVGLAAFVALHRHQGWLGMIAVALAGGGLTLIYLATGMLWVAMLVHVVIDLNALVLRPMLSPN